MPDSPSPQANALSQRIESIDVLRGLTILVMIFVNDLAGVQGAPAWMKHLSPSSADGMTFVDVVFPAFLFIVGVSMPFAIGRRLDKGEPALQVWRHILTRTLALLVIGVFMVNCGELSDEGVLSPGIWMLLMYVAVVFVWNTIPRDPGRVRSILLGLRYLGLGMLLVLAVLYRGSGDPGFIELRPQWWGILGLIGWAYLVACLVYTLFRGNLAALVGAAALLYCVYLGDRAGFFDNLPWITRWVGIGSMLGSHAAITVSGVILGMALTPESGLTSHTARIRWALLYGAGLAAAGVLLHSLRDIHEMFIINKNAATPPWCLLSSAFTVWIWVAIYWLMDVRGWKRWAVVVEPAGMNPLFAYILAPILYAVFGVLSFDAYWELGNSFAVGFWRSVVFAFGVTWLTGALHRVGVRLKL